MSRRVIENIANTLLVILLLAAVVSYNGKLLGKKSEEIFGNKKSGSEIEAPSIEQLSEAGYNGCTVEADTKGIWNIVDSNDDEVGTVISSIVFSKRIYGYAGPIPLLIFIDNNSVIKKVTVLENTETPRFMKHVIKKGIVDQWHGKSTVEAIAMKADVVSGATMSCDAINKSVVRSINALNKNNRGILDEIKDWNLKVWAALLVVISGIFMSFYARKRKSLRLFQIILNVVVLGLWCGQFISVSLIVGWLGNGVNLIAKISLTAMIVSALILPILFKKRSFYCTWVCPFGAAQELAGKITKKRWKIPYSAMKYLKYSRRVITIALFISMWFGIGFDIMNYEPFAAFLFSHAGWAVLSIAIISIIMSVFVDRPWCRFACPTGQILKWSEKLK
jgi:Na+-translocating ferredoxin:NAD+ oxidoreductase RnfG subunit